MSRQQQNVLIGGLASILVAISFMESNAGIISGHVTDASGAIPLENIVVEAYANTTFGFEFRTSKYTDANGHYEIDFASIGTGQYVIRFLDESGNYLPQFFQQAATFFTASNITVTLVNVVTGVDGRLDAASKITGTVFGPDQATPLPGIVVTAYYLSEEEAAFAVTDVNGFFEITGLFPGDYRLKFQDFSGDYVTEWFDDAFNLEDADIISVPVSATVSAINASLAYAAKLSGVVTAFSDSTPLENIVIIAYRWNGDLWEIATEAFSIEDGSYQIAGLRAGTYRLGFVDGSATYIDQYYDGAISLNEATDIEVLSADILSGYNAALFEGSTISGVVTDLADQPLSSVEVSALRWNGDDWVLVNVVYTDGNGAYEAGGLIPGLYRMRFDGSLNYGHPILYYQQTLDFALATDIQVDGGELIPDINAQLFTPPNHAPTDIVLSNSEVVENMPAGTTVGTLTTVDEDEDNTFVYTLVDGEGDVDNGLFAIDGDVLKAAYALNYESQSNRFIRIRSTDQGDLFVEKAFLISVIDVDEVPVISRISVSAEAELLLRWSSLTQQLFSIHASTNLMSGFEEIANLIEATPPLNTHTVILDEARMLIFQVQTDD